MRRVRPRARILVLAGPNGGGKSSLAGVALRQRGAEYFNPDEATRRIRELAPTLSPKAANSMAWLAGRDRLIEAIDRGLQFAIESTLGGRTMTGLLLEAARGGASVRVWYVALASVEQHIVRVRARAERGGHDIPEARIRARYDASRKNLIRLLPHLAELMLWDNSLDRDPAAGQRPEPLLSLHVRHRKLLASCPLAWVPDWAKPIVLAASGLLESQA